jgi:hypothetical protein
MNRSWQFWDGNRTPSGNKILTHTQYLPRHQLSSNETGADAKNPKTKISRWQKVVRTWLILWCWGYYKSIFGCLGILRVSRQFQASASLLHEGNFVIAFQVDDLSLISESKLKGSSELGLSAVRERSGIATKIQQGINNWAYMSLYIHIIYIYYIYIIHIYIYVQYMIHVLVPRPRTQNPGQLSTQKLPGRSTFSQWDWCPLPSFRGDLGSEHELKNCQLRTILLVRAKRRAAGWVMDGLLGWWHYEWWWNGSFPNIPCVKRSSKMKHRREHVM